MLDAFVELSWRAYPGGAMLALGIAAIVYGVATGLRGWAAPAQDRGKPAVFVAGLRAAILGTALAGLAGAWIWQQVWLLALALIFGGEELVETSAVLFVLRRGQRLQARRDAATRGVALRGPQ